MLAFHSYSHQSNEIKMPRKSFRLCHRDEYGTFSYGNRCLKLKSTALYREKWLRFFLRLALDDYNELVMRGMLTWEAYKERRLIINRSIKIIKGYLTDQRFNLKDVTRCFTNTPNGRLDLKEVVRDNCSS
jgi:hypothetical protein